MQIVGTFIGHAFYQDKKWKQQKNSIERSDFVPYLLCSWLTKKINTSFALSMLLIYQYYLLVLEENTEFRTVFCTFYDTAWLWCNSQITTPISFSSFIIYFSVLQVYLMTTLHFCLDELIFVKETHIVKLLIKQHVSLLIYMREKGGFWDTLGNQRPNWKEPGN